MAFRIMREPTAFSMSPTAGRKRPAQKNAAHLKWLHELPCLVTGKRPIEAAHVSYADPTYGKRERGKGEKTDDRWAVPLCKEEHAKQHSMGNERAYWASVGIGPSQGCRRALWRLRGYGNGHGCYSKHCENEEMKTPEIIEELEARIAQLEADKKVLHDTLTAERRERAPLDQDAAK